MNCLNAALNLHASGLNVLPIVKDGKGSYEPIKKIGWKRFQEKRQTKADVKRLFSLHHDGIAIICGKGSGNLEVIDVDSKNSLKGDHKFSEFVINELFEGTGSQLFKSLPIIKTKSNGRHILIRCIEIEGNQDLAYRLPTPEEKSNGGGKKKLIETRGQGGLIYCAPTLGYEVIQGGYEEIPEILPVQRDMIFGLMRMFDEVGQQEQREEENKVQKSSNTFIGDYKVSPVDDYNNRSDIIDELASIGLHPGTEDDKRIYLHREGSDHKQSGNILKENGIIYMWSTNTKLPAQRGLNPVSAYTYINHRPDGLELGQEMNRDQYSKAFLKSAKDLEEKGYGENFSDKELEARDYAIEQISAGKDPDQIARTVDTEFNSDVPGSVDTMTVVKAAEQKIKYSKKRNAGPFWTISDKAKVTIEKYKAMRFCSEVLGIKKYKAHKAASQYELVEIDQEQRTIAPIKCHEVKKRVERWILSEDLKFKGRILEAISTDNKVFKGDWFDWFPELKHVKDASKKEGDYFTFVNDTVDTSYYFFQNGYVEVNKEGYKINEYNQLPEGHLIWKNKKIDRNIKPVEFNAKKLSKCIWYKFLRRLSGIPEEYDDKPLNGLSFHKKRRWLSFATSIGFLNHSYKDVTKPYAILVQEDTDTDKKGGGSGKNLIFKGIEKMNKHVTTVNGKSFNPDNRFAYQRVEPHTDIVLVSDIEKKMDPEKLNVTITEGITVEKKRKDELFLSFDEAPKFAFTTNYTLKGKGSGFIDRRFKSLLVSMHFNNNHSPVEEFGRLFIDWDDEQWQLFYNLMFEFTRVYLRTDVVQVQDTPSLKIKSIKNEFYEPFYEWISEKIGELTVDESKEYLAKDLHIQFQEETEAKLGPYKFNEGLDKYCELFDHNWHLDASTRKDTRGLKVFKAKEGSMQVDEPHEEDLPF